MVPSTETSIIAFVLLMLPGIVCADRVVFTGLATVIVVLLAVASGTAVSVVDLVRNLLRGGGHDLIAPRGMRRIAQQTVWQTAFGRMTSPGVRVFLSGEQ